MLDNLNNIKIAVLGDLMLDKYISGYSERISPEAPVPIVQVKDENICLGGSGNVVANIASLGAAVYPAGIIGTDKNGNALMQLMGDMGISMDSILSSDAICTTTKTRVIANGQQVVRIDNEELLSNVVTDNGLTNYIDKVIPGIDLVIISDYGKGACSEKLVKHIVKKTNDLGKPLIIDPRKTVANFDNYKNCTVITDIRFSHYSIRMNIFILD